MKPVQDHVQATRQKATVEHLLFGRPITPRRAARLIAGSALVLTMAGGTAGWLFDKADFGSFGDSLWWAMQTVTTVGYGDVVPEHTTGRVIGAILMLNGLAFISVITASVTAILIEQVRRGRAESDEQLVATLERIDSRLAEIEAAGSVRSREPGD